MIERSRIYLTRIEEDESLLLFQRNVNVFDSRKLRHSRSDDVLFDLLQSLDRDDVTDDLDILEMVAGEKPLAALVSNTWL